jgi:hypothetical protein
LLEQSLSCLMELSRATLSRASPDPAFSSVPAALAEGDAVGDSDANADVSPDAADAVGAKDAVVVITTDADTDSGVGDSCVLANCNASVPSDAEEDFAADADADPTVVDVVQVTIFTDDDVGAKDEVEVVSVAKITAEAVDADVPASVPNALAAVAPAPAAVPATPDAARGRVMGALHGLQQAGRSVFGVVTLPLTVPARLCRTASRLLGPIEELGAGKNAVPPQDLRGAFNAVLVVSDNDGPNQVTLNVRACVYLSVCLSLNIYSRVLLNAEKLLCL